MHRRDIDVVAIREFVWFARREIASLAYWLKDRQRVYETAERFYGRLHDPRKDDGIRRRFM